MSELMPVEQAQAIILEHVTVLGTEPVALSDALGRTLAAQATSDIDIVPFDNSAMDGFAFRAADVQDASEQNPAKLDIVSHIAAGDWLETPLENGQCARIMTGAAMPAGADSVEKIEVVQYTGDGLVGEALILDHAVAQGNNVRYAGEEAKAGEAVMDAGVTLDPAAMGLLSSTGNVEVSVYKRPVVGILSFGSELVDAAEVPGPGKIRNSNRYALSGCVLRASAVPKDYGIVEDSFEAIKEAVARAAAECDFVISSGGASAGDFDYVTDVAADLGEVFFKYVNMRPGKSQTFAVVGGTPFLGLAGNPAAAVCGFEMLVYPALQKMQGRPAHFHPMQRAVLGSDAKKGGTRVNYQRGSLVRDEGGQLVATPYCNQSSALFGTLQRSDCLIVIPGEVNFLPAGSEVDCVRLDMEAGTVA